MKEQVSQTAGKVWRALGEQGPITTAQLAKTLKEKEEIINQAVGWLAREDKIKYITKGNRILIGLVETEQEIFKVLKNTPLVTK